MILDSLSTVWHALARVRWVQRIIPWRYEVLDSDARVYGVSNLRVVDSTSFPLLPPGHPQSVIGESKIHR